MKTINRYIQILLVGLLVSSCVERYYPDSEINFVSKLVIDGMVAADDGLQEIVISKSSPSADPKLIPVSGCTIIVEDFRGNRFYFQESNEKGHYLGYLEGGSVAIGNKYRLRVKTTEGKEYISRYEELMPCPEVSFVYYELQTKQTSDKDVNEKGLQFYIDFKGDNNYGRFYRWQLTQTYEYHSTWPLDRWLDVDGIHDLVKPDYSNYVCYKTDKLGDIFVLSTSGFTQNSYTKYKLHFVPDQTQVLQHKYSLLVRQHSLSEAAYNYWENLRKNNQENVDLFGKQPANVKGNIRNANDSTDVALGYFGVSTVRSKRIMVLPINGLSFNHVYRCRALVIDGPIPPDERPFYFAADEDAQGNRYVGRAGPECIFCTMHGGTTEKPTFWDNK